jgi:hypothetical protein
MNKQLPLWHSEYLNHIHYWNSSFTNEAEPMKIQFIPMNNKYMVKDHLEILKKIKERLINYNPDYNISLLNRPEGGFQLKNKKYYNINKPGDTNLQIRCNIFGNSQPYFLENKTNLYYELSPYPDPYNKSGLKIFEFVAYKNVPKKLMLYLYIVLESMNMLIYRTENYPDLNDIVWNHKSIWNDVYLYDPKN